MTDKKLENISEIVVNHIINKIISLTISRSLKIKTDNEVPNNCYEYVKYTINNILSSFYPVYDRDEPRDGNITNIKNEKSFFKTDDIENIENKSIINKENNNNNNTNFLEKNGDETDIIFKNYFFNDLYQGDNNWDLIEEPTSLSMDRYSSTLITFIEKNKNLDGGKYKMNQEGILEEEENEKEENNNDKEIEKEKEINKTNISRRITFRQKKEARKKLSEISNQLDYYDLEPEENNEVLESNQIKKLREQFEKSKKNKEIEKKIIHEEKEKLINIQKVNEEINRKYIGKKITKDHNGEIIFIKSIKPDKLKQDFIFGKAKFKSIVNESNRKKINTQKEQNKSVDNNTQENNKDKKVENKEKKSSKKVSVKSLPKLMNKLPMTTIDTIDKNDTKRIQSLKKNFPLITSGSNFELMNMEIGVSLKEDKKYKTGGLDFLSKFKKFSLKAYDKKLKEAEASNSLKKNIEIIEDPKSKTIEEMNNIYPSTYTMGYSTSYGNNNFSLTQTEKNNFLNKNMNNKMYSTNNSSMFNQYLRNINNNNFKNNNQRNNTFNPFIQLTMGSSSLFGTLDQLNLVSNEEEKNLKKRKRKNIFRETKKILLQKEKKLFLDDINNFTKNLMTNKKVELKNDEKMKTISGVRNPGKPDIREIIQEIGLKGKIMRNRSKILAPIKSNFLENENFFKQ